MDVLVTGGAGYIGSHTCKMLASAGMRPVVLDDLRRGHRAAVRWGPFVEGDCGDAATLKGIFENFSISAVIHLAAYAYVAESIQDPAIYFQNNVVATLNLLDMVRRHGIRAVVFSSSCATYGVPTVVPIPEGHPQLPISPYGESKLMVEKILHWYGASYGTAWCALRYFNAGGADTDGEIGEEHDPEPHLLPRVIAAAAGDMPCLEIYGVDHATLDGTAVRDYVHVNDLAAAHVLATRYLLQGGASTAFNLGTGKGHSVRQIITTAEEVTGRKIPITLHPRRSGDPAELVADPTKAQLVLQWSPKCSDIGTILETAWKFYNRKERGCTNQL